MSSDILINVDYYAYCYMCSMLLECVCISKLIQQTFLEKLIFLLKMSASCIKFLFCHMTDCGTLNEVIYTLYLQLDLADG